MRISDWSSDVCSSDLFVDCTGFASRLLGDALDVPFVDCSDVLFIDRALAVQVPYESEDSPVVSHTVSTGQKHGWIWDIGLKNRRGVGYVYSSNHAKGEDVEAELARSEARRGGKEWGSTCRYR